MDLSQFLRSTVLTLIISILCLQQALSGYIGSRPKRQYGANMYLSATYIIPGGEGNDIDWDEWQSPSECSRSCGGGVSYQTRECLRTDPNTGASLCSGGTTRYFSCNTQDCPEEEPDFRSQQCARYNNQDFDGVYYDWVPYTNAPNPCELNCMPRGERFYFKQQPKVIDGTRCNDRDLDVCVDGQCQPVGCDLMLGSDAKEDKCRKCGGDGGSCHTVADTYKSSILAAGYNDILLIPAGATNIKIQETEPSNNYLACRNLTSYYYLNGNWRIDFPNTMEFAGCWWNYQRKPNGFAAPDQLTCSGPTSESIYIVMLVQDKTVSVDYEYSIPTAIHKSTPQVYTWTHTQFGDCSVNCGGGVQTRTVTCNNRFTLDEVDTSLCDVNAKPEESQECGTEPCAPNWQEDEWGKCSKGCGSDGIQNRTVSCVRISPKGERKVEEDAVCLKLVGNKPATQQECNRDVKNCPKYHLGPWTPCDKLCGESVQHRKVTCYIEENGRKKVLDDSECIEDKPPTEKPCMLTPCEGVDWIISEWSGCNACGQTVETRTAICGSVDGKIYADEFCQPEVPTLTRPCKSKKCLSQWFTSEWSECSASCGKGIQSRIVICGEFDGKSVKPADDGSKCSADKKPETKKSCEGLAKECPGQFFTGPWGPCDKPCGGGQRVREILCLANGTKSSNCDESKLESLSEKCNIQPCDEDELTFEGSTQEPFTASTSSEEEFEGCEDYDEEDEDEEEEDVKKYNPKDEVENIPKSGKLQLATATTVGAESSVSEDDDLMLSDAPTVDDISTTDSDKELSTTELTTDASTVTESFSTTEFVSTTESMTSETTVTESTESTELESTTDVTTESTTDSSTETTVTESTASTGSESLTDLSTESTTDSSTESTVTVSADTTEDVSTESTTESSTETTVTESTQSTGSESESTTDSSTESTTESSTETTVTESSDSTESTTDVSTESTTEYSTESTVTVSTDTTEYDSTESITDSSTETTVTEFSYSTESTTDVSTESTTEYSTESTVTVSTDTTEDVSTESTTDSSTETTVTESSYSTESTTDVSTESTSESSTESTVTEPTETTEFVSTESTTESSTETTVTESTESTESTTDISTESTTESSTESTFTELTETTESLSTDSTTESTDMTDSTESSTTDSSTYSTLLEETSTVTEDEEEGSGSTTPYTFTTIVDNKNKCKLKKKKNCKTSKYGCCPDKKTPATGPFEKGCKIPKTCAETKFGCCPDGVSPAQGKNNKGCPKSQCAETLFGCCPDKYTPAEGEDNEGCPEPTTLSPTTTQATTDDDMLSTTEYSTETTTIEDYKKTCGHSEFGCCPDGETEAKGENFQGCETEPQDCKQSTYGCCRDGRTPAQGDNQAGCPSCTQELFGCCPDNETPAHGPLGEGCCLNSPYGCCPDNINSASGPNGENCSCENTPYGCCPDKKTTARGPANEGCGCENMEYGCCPDKLTAAKGEKFEGCPCHTMQYGCCPDGLTYAKGPHHYGCHCSQTDFKCCGDEKTPARGPDQEGCTCVESKYGCCPDGVSVAEDENFAGCENVTEPIQKSCGLPKSEGNGTNYAIKYFFDTSYGSCAKFWYAGSGGNENRFDSERDCKRVCEEVEGKERCLLPMHAGPCTGDSKKFYYDADRGRCEEFTYGGCYGNTNRFDTIEECQNMCDVADSSPPCEQPADSGPCEGTYERWFYDNETDVCRPFNYGGCKGNKNNHPTEHACNYNCRQPGIFKDQCLLPKQSGDCSEQHPRWYYDETLQKCEPFYYTGCGGNKNNFPSLESCESHCPKKVVKDICEMPAQVGECSNYKAMWYFDTKEQRCQQFYYGGCGGNDHKFATEEACLARCEKKQEETTLPPPASVSDICIQPAEQGNCEKYEINWYYNTTYGTCNQFYYGGCGGNSNRFRSESECLQRCHEQPATTTTTTRAPAESQTDHCQLAPDVGDCDDYTIKYFYNATSGTCDQFYYGGCAGNDNRFSSESDCTYSCSSPPSAPEVQQTDPCFSPADPGQCSENVERWYYNSNEGLCDAFTYTGCGGNTNNYGSEEECNTQCSQKQNTCSLPPAVGRCGGNMTRWYFDEAQQRCNSFQFTGCRGNRNNFIDERECMEYCRPSTNDDTNQPPSPYAYCELPAESGNCTNFTAAYFFDSETQQCTAFTYTGCGGNANRFETKEQCERQCGEYRGIDVCSEPMSVGPCKEYQSRFFFNSEYRTCEPFTYGGCQGTANRFADRAECESVCIVGSEPQSLQNKEICKLPVVVGKCNIENVYDEKRYYYDDERGECVAFIYSGCSGNQNNFHSYQACHEFCKIENEASNEIIPSKCEVYENECRSLQCSYGVRQIDLRDENNCYRCQCVDPCDGYDCPEGQQCKVDVDSAREFVPVCRETNKPGDCPAMSAVNRICGVQCYTDADCSGENKCCSNGCGFLCVRPYTPPVTLPPTLAPPKVLYPGEKKAELEPKQPHELDVSTSLGNIALLRCYATGSPPPNVTWSRRNVQIDTSQGRYILTTTGDLNIVQVKQTDSGSYVCVASNGLGEPVRREVQLEVTALVQVPAYIGGERNITQIATLNMPIVLRCLAGGYPEPMVTWRHNRRIIPKVTSSSTQMPDNSLYFPSLQLSDLGLYICHAFNDLGRPMQKKIILKAYGPARASRPEEEPFLQYVVNPVFSSVTERPSYPYRPTRPAAVPPPPASFYITPPPTRGVKAKAILEFDSGNTYTLGTNVTIRCLVEGYPPPDVSWKKNDVEITPNERIHLTSQPYTLVITNARPEDAGLYSCKAQNYLSHSTDSKNLDIEISAYVPPDCQDNPYYANCARVVRGQYCKTNRYFAKFCCRSCVLSNQITWQQVQLNGIKSEQ